MATDVKISADLLLAADFILLFTLSKIIANKDTALEKSKVKRQKKSWMTEKIYLNDICHGFLLLYLKRNRYLARPSSSFSSEGSPWNFPNTVQLVHRIKWWIWQKLGIWGKKDPKSPKQQKIWRPIKGQKILIPCGWVEEGLNKVASAPSLIRHLLVWVNKHSGSWAVTISGVSASLGPAHIHQMTKLVGILLLNPFHSIICSWTIQ